MSGPEIAVSVVIANFNGEKFIAEAIRSVCRQVISNIEIIVADDASTDSSLAIVKSLMQHDNRIRLLESSKNGGPAAARNRALDVARGEWVAIVDGDDLLHPDRLRRMIEEGSRTGADVVADDLLLFESEARTAPRPLLTRDWSKSPRWLTSAEYIAANHFYGRGPALGYLKPLIRRSSIARLNARYDERLRIAEDYNFILQLLMQGARFWIFPEIGYFYRRHAGSISHRLDRATLASIEQTDRDWGRRWKMDQGDLAPVFQDRMASVRRAIIFEDLVEAIKSKRYAAALSIVFADPVAALLLRFPVRDRFARLFRRDRRSGASEKRQVCLLTRQRVVGRVNGSSRYLLDLVQFLVERGLDVHLLSPSPSTMGRWPFLKLSGDMAIFKTIRIRGTFRCGNYIVGLNPVIALNGAIGLLDRVLRKSGLLSRPLSRPAPFAVAQPLTRADQLFVARHAPPIGDIQIADYCFLTQAFPYGLRPDAKTLVVMHDLFSSRSSQFAAVNASDSVVALPLEDEVKMLAMADTIVAIQSEEAAVLRKMLPGHDVVVAPMAAVPVAAPQPGRDDMVLFVGSSAAPNVDGLRWFLEACWPIIHSQRPNAVLHVAGTVCNDIAGTAPHVRLLNIVEDLGDLYEQAGVVISPLRAGSGLKIKLIEGLSKGKAMVVTPATLQGVSDLLAGCVTMQDDADKFAMSVIELLGDENRRHELGALAIEAISGHFSPAQAYRAFAAAAVSRTGIVGNIGHAEAFFN